MVKYHIPLRTVVGRDIFIIEFPTCVTIHYSKNILRICTRRCTRQFSFGELTLKIKSQKNYILHGHKELIKERVADQENLIDLIF